MILNCKPRILLRGCVRDVSAPYSAKEERAKPCAIVRLLVTYHGVRGMKRWKLFLLPGLLMLLLALSWLVIAYCIHFDSTPDIMDIATRPPDNLQMGGVWASNDSLFATSTAASYGTATITT